MQVSRGAKAGEISLAQATALLASKGLLREWRVQQTSGVTGDPAARRVHVLSLSRDDVRFYSNPNPNRNPDPDPDPDPNPNPNPSPNPSSDPNPNPYQVRMAFSSCLSSKDQIRRLRPLPRKTGRANPLPPPSSRAAERAQEVPTLTLP